MIENLVIGILVIAGYSVTGMMVVTCPPIIDGAFGKWCDTRRTEDAQAMAFLLAVVFWPISFLICMGMLFKYLLFASKGAPGAVWRGLRFLGRGVRDLLPERKAKLPRAVVKK